ncbi:MAG: thioredoxin fold domain-containing protein [Candidatus Marinimicrobia bacterium]|nr:thioredoxin fold domain-containing protein [Candidatus Neomarinimicrobiota bacterium]
MKYFQLIIPMLSFLWGQIQNPVTITATINDIARAGEIVKMDITLHAEDEWHIYSIYESAEGPLQTAIEIYGNAISETKPVQEPEPHHAYDSGFDTETYFHEGTTTFTTEFKLRKSITPGEYEISADVFYQICNAQICYPPTTKTATATLIVEDGQARYENLTFSQDDVIQDKGDSGFSLWGLFLLAIGGAMLSWIMPCVYPMLPIIISFFGKHAEEKDSSRVTVASFYGLGIIGTFVFTGLVVGGLSYGVADIATKTSYANLGNIIATNPWVNLALGVVFIFFALWMFGAINIIPPGWLVNKTDKAGRTSKSTFVGAFFLGVAFAITSFSCTVPVVGSLLVVAATGTAGAIMTSLFGMLVYGVVFAVPFVALSLFPSAISKMPNSGYWMETMKIIFGFIELAAAIKFLWVPDMQWNIGLLPRNIVLGLFLIVGLALIAYLLGFYTIGQGEKKNPFQVAKSRYVGVGLTVIILWPIYTSMMAAPTYHADGLPRIVDEIIEALVPPSPSEDEIAQAEGWFVDDYKGALQMAQEKGLPLFVDFTGIYCANCRVMERRVFPKNEVKKRFEKMVLVRLYVDKNTDLSKTFAQMQFERYQVASQPYYVILDPKDESTLSAEGGYIPDKFVDFLDQGLKEFSNKDK